MNNERYKKYINLLKDEMLFALGCTEPIAIAYAAATARKALGFMPERAEVYCSGNIVKNVKSVTVPNSGGMRGIEIAAILGILGGNPDNQLEVLSDVTDEHRKKGIELLRNNFCKTEIKNGIDNLYVEIRLFYGKHSSEVVILHKHTFIYSIKVDGNTVIQNEWAKEEKKEQLEMSVHEILEFVSQASVKDLQDCIAKEIATNSQISLEGLSGDYGAQIGKTIISSFGSSVRERAVAAAAAGSDARMNGCALPVVINSGSGNQGMTVSLPVLEYAKELKSSKEETLRAIALSNLVSIHIKRNIGDLSAFCGAVSAGSGAGAAITYLYHGTEEQIGNTIINTLANVGGLICDGAKSSCAAKIATSVNAAILAHEMSMKGLVFQDGEGLVQKDAEETIKSISYIGRSGMAKTDEEVLKVMLGIVKF